jgi:hypothetical protein
MKISLKMGKASPRKMIEALGWEAVVTGDRTGIDFMRMGFERGSCKFKPLKSLGMFLNTV